MFKEISKCRICGSKQLAPVMTLGNLALTGIFPKTFDEPVARGPLNLVKCDDSSGCGLVQLKQSYNRDDMYGWNYGYRSGLNKSMTLHLEKKVQEILDLNILEKGDLVVDIGSNDSTTLQAYPGGLYELVGVDPTGIKFNSYYPPKITLIPEFFSAQIFSRVFPGRKAKVITSFAMFYDIESPVEFAQEIEQTLHDDGIWVLEQSYMPAMLEANSFDTICHEHIEFYSLRQIVWICRESNLKVLDVDFNDVNGGSFSITVAKAKSKYIPNTERIETILADEEALESDKADAFEGFRTRIERERRSFVDFLCHARATKKSVYALGASTKGNVLLQYYEIDATLIRAIGEVNLDKLNSFTPGSKIPIVSENSILSSKPDYIVILPWHFKEFFLRLEKLKGNTLIFPLPSFEIIQV